MELKTLAIQNVNGNAQAGVNCHLYHVGTRDYVSGLQDSDDNPLTNPFLSSRRGEAIFKAPDGLYDLVVFIAGKETTRRIQCLDVNTVSGIEQQLALLLYKAPSVDSFLIDGAGTKVAEQGSSVETLILSWVLSGASPQAQTISNGVGDVVVGSLQKTLSGPFTTNQNWTLSISGSKPDGSSAHDQASVSLNFRLKRYWGVSANPNLSNAAILALSNEFATSKGKSITYDASGGRYPYYCYPASWGAISAVSVGGLAFSAYTETIQPFTNASGHTEDYRVIRFNGLQTGANIQVVWS